jgi:enamine deaminase RidA (YjgF/YER057c/UK114 family)
LRKSVHSVDTSGVDRQRISSGAAFEDALGYSRAVRAGPHVWISGTAPIMPGDADPPPGAYDQARICIDIVARALGEAGATLDQVVRTRIYVTDAVHLDEVARVHREAFGKASPATTGIVTRLLDPRWLVEIEAEAYID